MAADALRQERDVEVRGGVGGVERQGPLEGLERWPELFARGEQKADRAPGLPVARVLPRHGPEYL